MKLRLRLTIVSGKPERTAIMFACKEIIETLGYRTGVFHGRHNKAWFDITIPLQAIIDKRGKEIKSV